MSSHSLRCIITAAYGCRQVGNTVNQLVTNPGMAAHLPADLSRAGDWRGGEGGGGGGY